jgi:D-alanyl-D-alanine carboxypeptidase/D-alanyl-D-alanine-endopeptidase (penicillin-binding protein 4)
VTSRIALPLLGLLVLAPAALAAPAAAPPEQAVPQRVLDIIGAPQYAGATWGLRAVDVESGRTVMSLGPDAPFFTGSVRKLFSVAVALDTLGPGHRFTTPVHRRGPLRGGVLDGDLVLVASGDLTLGGRTTRTGRVAYTALDHVDADGLGAAALTGPDPLAGIRSLARGVARSGVRRVTGDVVVDDRLWRPFRVPNGNVLITPIVVNDNLVDVTVTPTRPGRPARVDWRPRSAAFTVRADVRTGPRGSEERVELVTAPDGRSGVVRGVIPAGYTPPLAGATRFVRTFTIADPPAYARTVLIEALRREGVRVDAPATGRNPAGRLPRSRAYPRGTRVARYVSPPYSEYARLILKVSHNLGANLSLMYGGLARGARTRDAALRSERQVLVRRFGVPADGFSFPTNGSGSPDSRATAGALVSLLTAMSRRPEFGAYRAGLPVLGVDGSLASVGRRPPNPVIARSFGRVRAKTGTTFSGDVLRAKNLAGYIDAASGRRLAYVLYANDISPIRSIQDIVRVIADQGEISALVQQSG